jgi:hypothetical protein
MRAFAVMLLALLVVRAPIATVDRVLHDVGHGHAANAFADALLDSPDHGHHHDGDRAGAADDDHAAPSVQLVADDTPDDPATPAPHHHHHHDGASVYGPVGGVTLPEAWSSEATPFRLRNDLRNGIEDHPRDRPPKALLAHVA